jgi:hypothetical protein
MSRKLRIALLIGLVVLVSSTSVLFAAAKYIFYLPWVLHAPFPNAPTAIVTPLICPTLAASSATKQSTTLPTVLPPPNMCPTPFLGTPIGLTPFPITPLPTIDQTPIPTSGPQPTATIFGVPSPTATPFGGGPTEAPPPQQPTHAADP